MKKALSLSFIIIVFVLGYFTRDFIDDSSHEEQNKSQDTTVISPPETAVRIMPEDPEIICSAANLEDLRSSEEKEEKRPDIKANTSEDSDSGTSVTAFGKTNKEFDAEERKENWSQDQEFFISESLNSQQFADTFDIKELTCKASICKLTVYKSTADLYSDRNIPEADWNNIVRKISVDIDMITATMEMRDAQDSDGDIALTVYFQSKPE